MQGESAIESRRFYGKMNTCLCGNAVDQEGALCERCAALQILGLGSNASYREIEKTYRVLVKVWHPDRFQTDARLRETADEKLKSINAAHAYLTSTPQPRTRKRAPKPPATETGLQPTAQPRRSLFLDPAVFSGILLRCLVLLIGLAVPAILLFALDSWLASNPTTASFYGPYRSQMLFTLRTNVTAVGQSLHRLLPEHTDPAATASPTAPPDLASAMPTAVTVPVPSVPMPYVTVGLTKNEVLTVMGAPLASTPNAVAYRNAVFYLHNGVVVGWKVDPSLIPLRVKLWPSGHPDPHLTAFTIGSSRNDVIAVQGTPTMLSENKLAYGGSEVFFDDGRVIGWNDNHASERLRVAAH